MKPTEAAALLTIAAAFDNRKPDADQAKAWAMALDGLRFEDCREVIVAHYRKSRDWLMPVDIVTGVKRLRAQRLADFGPIPAPKGIDPDDTETYTRARLEMQTRIADGDLVREDDEPVALPARDVIRELGHIGQTVDEGLTIRSLRAAHAEAKRTLQAAEADRKRAEDERRAELERMRREDQAARDAIRVAKGGGEEEGQ